MDICVDSFGTETIEYHMRFILQLRSTSPWIQQEEAFDICSSRCDDTDSRIILLVQVPFSHICVIKIASIHSMLLSGCWWKVIKRAVVTELKGPEE